MVSYTRRQSMILLLLVLVAGPAAQAKAQDTTRIVSARVAIPVKMGNGMKAWNAFMPHVQPRFEGGECRRFNTPDGLIHLTMAFPNLPQRHTTVTIMLTPAGDMVRYVENRAEPRSPVAGAAPMEARTTFQVDYQGNKIGLLMNTGLGATEGVRIPLEELQRLPEFAAVSERIKAVVERCGSSN